MKNLKLIAAFLFFSSCVLASHGPAHLMDFNTVLSVRIAKISGYSVRANSFHDYIVVGKWRRFTSASQSRIGELLHRRLEDEIKMEATQTPETQDGDDVITLAPMCFDPGLAVQLETDKGRRDFLICLHCSFFYVYDQNGKEAGMSIDEDLSKALKKEYERYL